VKAIKELRLSILEDWGLSEKYQAIKRAEQVLAEHEKE